MSTLASVQMAAASSSTDTQPPTCHQRPACWLLVHDGLQTPVIDLKLQTRHAGCNSFRLSLEWSRIFPQRGVIDQSAVDRHHQIFDALDR